MARPLYTVEQLAESVRSRIDELNRDTIDTERDILPALNRALEYAVDIYAKHYVDPFLAYTTIDLTSAQEYTLPEDVYEDRIVKLETKISSNTYQEIQRISYKDITNYESDSNTSTPYYYAVVGRKLRLLPTPSGSYDARLWYVKYPEQLVLPQGRVTLIGSNNRYLVVDSIGADLTSEINQLNSFINIINSRTGEIKGTFQIASLDDSRITIRQTASQDRTTIFGKEILFSLADLGIAKDDYVCVAAGTCVPYLASPTSNFLIQYAVAELSRQLGVNSAEEEQVLSKFEDQVKRTWSGRETTTRIAKRSAAYGTPLRNWYIRTRG
jgi:hypothetical protein